MTCMSPSNDSGSLSYFQLDFDKRRFNQWFVGPERLPRVAISRKSILKCHLRIKLLGIHKGKKHCIISPSEKALELPNFTWTWGAYIQKSLVNQSQLKICSLFLATAFSLSYFLKTVGKFVLFIGPVYMKYAYFYIYFIFILYPTSFSIVRPSIFVYTHGDMAVFTFQSFKGNENFQGHWKEKN